VPYLGETMALVVALVWACAVILFKKSGETVHPVALNLLKNVIAVALLIPTILLLGQDLFPEAPPLHYTVMLAGGLLGISFSDTLFFKSLNMLGASRMAIVDCLYSPFIIGLSVVFLDETLSWLQVVGVLAILGAVLTPLFEVSDEPVERRLILWGTVWGALALATMAVSLVAVKPVLNQSPVLWSALLRMAGGLIGLLAYLALHPGRWKMLRTLRGPGLKYSVLGSVVGGYLAMMLWLGGMKYTQASVAAALNQTTNVFIFILAAWVLKESITHQRVVGIALGVGGALMVTFL
jgi:drug/metabolite transporter (DMT)-like permease